MLDTLVELDTSNTVLNIWWVQSTIDTEWSTYWCCILDFWTHVGTIISHLDMDVWKMACQPFWEASYPFNSSKLCIYMLGCILFSLFFLLLSWSATCILRWASYTKKPTCPQCKHPFEFLIVHRSLDGRFVHSSFYGDIL